MNDYQFMSYPQGIGEHNLMYDNDLRIRPGFGFGHGFGGFGHGFGYGRPGFGFGYGRPGFGFGPGIGLGFLGGLATGALLAPGPGFGYGYGYGYPYGYGGYGYGGYGGYPYY